MAINRSSGTRKILLEPAAWSILMPVMVLTFTLGTPGHAVATRRVLHVREEKADGGGERFREGECQRQTVSVPGSRGMRERVRGGPRLQGDDQGVQHHDQVTRGATGNLGDFERMLLPSPGSSLVLAVQRRMTKEEEGANLFCLRVDAV